MLAQTVNHSAPRPVASPPGGIPTIDMLASFGVQLVEGRPQFSDHAKAEHAYIHHATVPVAAVAMSQISTTFARGRFPKLRLVDLVSKRPSMDGPEAIALGAVCGVDVAASMWPISPAPAFKEHLDKVLYRHGIEHLFGHDPARPASHEIDVKPRGIDWRTDQVIDAAMKEWRRAFRGLPSDRQMMAATVMWLYRGGPDKLWMRGLPCNAWHAADAIATLRAAGRLRDWGKLVALYPGW